MAIEDVIARFKEEIEQDRQREEAGYTRRKVRKAAETVKRVAADKPPIVYAARAHNANKAREKPSPEQIAQNAFEAGQRRGATVDKDGEVLNIARRAAGLDGPGPSAISTQPVNTADRKQEEGTMFAMPPSKELQAKAVTLPVKESDTFNAELEYRLKGMNKDEVAALDAYLNTSRHVNPNEKYLTMRYTESGEDEGKRALQFLRAMGYSDSEIDKLAEYRKYTRDAEYGAEEAEKYSELGKEHPVLATAVSTVGKALGTFGGAATAAEAALTGKPLNTNSWMLSLSKDSDALRQGVTDRVDWNVKGTDLFDAGYGILTSTADSLVAAYTGGGSKWVSSGMIGMQAGTQSMVDIAERGGTAGQAIVGGIAAGVFETLFESFSIGNFNKLKETPVTGIRSVAGNLGKSMLVNGSEEAATEAANIVWDTLMNGDISNYALIIENYMSQGYSESEAKRLVAKQLAMQVVESGVTGAIQGGFMSGVGMVSSKLSDMHDRWTQERAETISSSEFNGAENAPGVSMDNSIAEQGSVQTGENAAVPPRMSAEDYANSDSPVWNNVPYDDIETRNRIQSDTHKAMVDEGKVVAIPEAQNVQNAYPDLRDMSKSERVPILKEKMQTLKQTLREFLRGLRGIGFEFEVNGNVLEARLYDTGIREVLSKVNQDKANMLLGSDAIFRNAEYLYSTPDYDSDPNVYRWNYFYTPIQIGDGDIQGVRIAVRDMAPKADGKLDSQIYNWGIKREATLDGGGRVPKGRISSDVSSVASPDAPLGGGGPGQKPNTTGASSDAPSSADHADQGTDLAQGAGQSLFHGNTASRAARSSENANEPLNPYHSASSNGPPTTVDAANDSPPNPTPMTSSEKARAGDDSPVAGAKGTNIDSNAYGPADNPIIAQEDGIVNKDAQQRRNDTPDGTGADDVRNAGEKKTSAFYDTIQNSNLYSDETKSTARENKAQYEYEVKHNRDTVEKAYYDLQDDYAGSVSRLYEKLNSNIELDPEDVAAVGALARAFENAGDQASVNRLFTLARKKFTKYGQNIQAIKLFQGLTSDGKRSAAQSILDEAGIEADPQFLEHISTLSTEANQAYDAGDVNALYDLIHKVSNERGYDTTKLGRAYNDKLMRKQGIEWANDAANALIMGLVYDKVPKSVAAKISTYQTMSHLLNPRTICRNLVSNFVMDIVDTVANDVGSIPDAFISMFVAHASGLSWKQARSMGLEKSWLSKGKRTGARESARASALDISLDINTDDGSGKYGTSTRRTFDRHVAPENANIAQKAVTAIKNIPNTLEGALSYGLTWTDEFHKGGVKGESQDALNPLIRSEGRVTQEVADKWNEQRALDKSFQRKTIPGRFLQGIHDWMNAAIGFGDSGKRVGKDGYKVHEFGAGDFVSRYNGVPGALVTTAIEYTPMGYVKAIYNLVTMGKALNQTYGKGKGNRDAHVGGQYRGQTNYEVALNAQRSASMLIGRATTGTGLLAAFATLTKLGILMLSGDSGDYDKDAQDAAEGRSGIQINLSALNRIIRGGNGERQVGDELYSLDFLEPLNTLMYAGAQIADEAEDKNLIDFAEISAVSAMQSMLDLPAMSTISNIVDNFSYKSEDESYLDVARDSLIETVGSGITGFIPGPVRQFAQARDGVQRDTSADTAAGKIKNQLIATIPYARETLPEKTDGYGQVKTYSENDAVRWANAMVSPGSISTNKQSEVSKEVEMLSEQSGKSLYPDRKAPNSVTYDSKSYKLTAEEKRAYHNLQGQTTGNLMQELIDADAYAKMSVEEKAQVVGDIMRLAEEVAKVQFFENRGVEYKASSSTTEPLEAQEAGIDLADWYKAKLMHDEIDYGTQSATKKAADFAHRLTTEDYTPEQRKLLREQLTYSGGYTAEAETYDKLVKSGLSSEKSLKLYDGMSWLSNPNEHTKAQYIDKATYLNNSEKLKAMSVYLSDSAYQKYATANSYGIDVEDWTKINKAISKLGNVNQENAKIALEQADWLTDKERAYGWAILCAHPASASRKETAASKNPFGYVTYSDIQWVS